MTWIRILLVMTVAAWPVAGTAQTDLLPLTIEEAVKLALERNPEAGWDWMEFAKQLGEGIGEQTEYYLKQFEKELRSVRPDGTLPAVVPCREVQQQAAFVAQRVLELRDEGTPLPEIAVLYRAHYQSLELQLELTRRGIPFEIRSGLRFFEQQHVKDVLAFLRVSVDPRDETAFKRAVKLLPRVGCHGKHRRYGAGLGPHG